MPLHRILKSHDEPVRPEVTNQIITYNALNDGEFLLRCHTDVNENELVSEFDALFKEDKKTEEEKNNEPKEPL